MLLGSNLGDRVDNLRSAERLLEESKIKTLNESSIYETEPWGKHDQCWFLNVVLQVETSVTPKELLDTCLNVEKEMGRKRIEKWGSRLIDIDILYYNEVVLLQDGLTIPHPEIATRKFTLVPMSELAPAFVHPNLNLSQTELLAKCTDELDCRLTEFRL